LQFQKTKANAQAHWVLGKERRYENERRRERERQPERDKRFYCCIATMRGKRKKNKLQPGSQISFPVAEGEVTAAVV